MRKEYGKALRSLFGQKILKTLPEFSPVKVSGIYFIPGNRAFEKKLTNGESHWINLNIDPKFERFTVEIGWSALGRWPELSMCPSPIRPDHNIEFAEQEYITRLPFLWTTDDYWFEIEAFNPNGDLESLMRQMAPIDSDKANERVEPIVEECVATIVEYANPYFEERTKRNA
ncbi:MAG: hypothetical protein ABW157_18280 [Candidatus Thiodiazotropha sp. LLP2]